MRIFISHSWKDKTFADKLAGDLEGVGEIWLDSREAKPGERIGEEVYAGIDASDVIIVLWSANAAASRWVGKEAAAGIERGKLVLPCHLDATAAPEEWRDLVAISFRNLPDDYEPGFMRLNLALFKAGAAELGLDASAVLGDLDDVDGLTNYLNDYRAEKGVEGDGAYWIDRILAATNKAHESTLAFRSGLEGTVEFVQELNERMQTAWDDPVELRAVLQEVIAHEQTAPSIFENLRMMIEQRLGELPPTRAVPTAAPATPGAAGKPGKLRKKDVRKQEIRAGLGDRVPAAQATEVVDALYYYVKKAEGSLAALQSIALSQGSAAGLQVCQSLQQYLAAPEDLLPEAVHGYFGLIDDAWLVHNTAYRLVESGLIDAGMFPVEWPRIVAADGVVRALLPAPVLAQLEAMLMQYLQVIAAEVQAYQPQFSRQGGHYNAYMPGGQTDADRWYDLAVDSIGLM